MGAVCPSSENADCSRLHLAFAALLTILQEQKIKQAMASSYITPGALEGTLSQIYDLDWDDQIYISEEDGTPVFTLHERFELFYGTA